MTIPRAVFKGFDTADNADLWVTDGTSTGTMELAVAGAYSGGVFSNGNVDFGPDFIALGTKTLFVGGRRERSFQSLGYERHVGQASSRLPEVIPVVCSTTLTTCLLSI
jgi:hypothetical protein